MFAQTILRSLARRKRRKVAAFAAIWIGVTLMSGLLTVSLVVGDRLNRELQSFGANIRVLPADAAVSPLAWPAADAPSSLQAYLREGDLPKLKDEIFWRNNILGIVPRLSVRAELNGREVPFVGVWIDHALLLKDGKVFRTGARSVYRDWSVTGSWPAKAGECLVGADLARSMALKPSSLISLQAGAASLPLRVSGILSTGGQEDGAVVAGLGTVQAASGVAGRLTRVDVSALATPEDRLAKKYHEDPASLTPQEYERWACVAYPGCIALDVQNAFKDSAANVVRQVAETQGALLDRIQGLIAALASLAAVASVLCVLGVLAAAILERDREAALLRALGARRRSVFALFLSEAACLGLAGGLLAALTGPAIGVFLVKLIFGTGSPPPGILMLLSPWAGLVISLLAGLWPAWRVTAKPPAGLLHSA